MGGHLIDGEFQSDKYPTCPRGKVPLSVKDKTAQDLLWLYAQRRRAVDAEFAADLETALADAGYKAPIGNVIEVARDIVKREGASDREKFVAHGLLGLMNDASLLMDMVEEDKRKVVAERDDLLAKIEAVKPAIGDLAESTAGHCDHYGINAKEWYKAVRVARKAVGL